MTELINTVVDIGFNNINLIVDSKLNIQKGQVYGLVAKNGDGKTSLLKHISTMDLDVFYVHQELHVDQTKSIFDIVIEANEKRMKIIHKLDALQYDENINMEEVNMFASELDKDNALVKKILYGLGFSNEQQLLPFSIFSGGWRMRVVLARGLYMRPGLLLLDEPTNHLDINSVIWLTDYLKKYKNTMIIVSHNTHFLNQLCQHIIHLQNKQLTMYHGNYDVFRKQYENNIRVMEKKWKHVQNEVKGMRKKGDTKEKVDKYMNSNKHLEPQKPYIVKFKFKISTKVTQNTILSLENINFSYDDKPLLDNINIHLSANEKITIVGHNGAGKSTLFKIITKQLTPISGKVIHNVNFGLYNQHVTDILPLTISPVDYLLTLDKINAFDARKMLGNVGLSGNLHLKHISTLSGGQKARVALAALMINTPHVLLLDEPTNHLDIESIDSLIDAINQFNGVVIMITHNIDVIERTNSTVYALDKQLVQIDMDDYYDKITNI